MPLLEDVYSVTHIPIDQLHPAGDNLRQTIGDLDELVASIHAVGIIEPLVVVPAENGYEVLAGNRRLAAAFEAGLERVPCCVRPDLADPQRRTEVMLVENLQRAGLNPIEEATGYARLVELGLSQRQVAERVGCNQSHVSKRIKLLVLPEAGRAKVVDGSLLVNDALSLAELVELDAASADEWLADPRWPNVTERIRRAQIAKRAEASAKEGKKSKLIDAREWDWNKRNEAGLVIVDREQATHWSIDHSGELRWFGPEPEEDEADEAAPTSTPTPAEVANAQAAQEWRAREEARIAFNRQRFDAIREWLAEVDGPDRHWFIDQVANAVLAVISVGGEALGSKWDLDRLNETPEARATWFADATDDPMLLWATATFLGLVETMEVEDPTDPAASLIIAVLDGIGVALTDEERAISPQTDVDEPEIAPDAAVVVATPVDDTEPPWKAYPFVPLDRLLEGIAQHGNVHTLRSAVAYEAGHENRPEVLDALERRIGELSTAA